VEAYHVLIAKLVMSDAYAIFTNSLIEDRIYLDRDWRCGRVTTTPAPRGVILAIGRMSTGG
jgi:hypothetical protein